MLNDFQTLLPVLPFLLGIEHVCMWATDHEKYVCFEDRADLNTGVSVGSYLKPGDTAIEAMKLGKTIQRVVPKEVFGRELRTYVVPVEGGSIGITFEEEERMQVIEAIQLLKSYSSQVNNEIQQLTSGVGIIEKELNKVQQFANESQAFHNELTDIIGTILHIVDELQLLSLNALLVASKAGEDGRTFTVVADEIKKMASVGEEQMKEIETLLQFIVSSLASMQENVEWMKKESENLVEQSHSLEFQSNEVAVTVMELDRVTERLR